MRGMGKHRSERTHFEAGRDDAGKRLDRVLRTLLSDLPLGEIYRSIRTGEIRVNGKRARPDYRVEPGDVIEVPANKSSSHGRKQGNRQTGSSKAAVAAPKGVMLTTRDGERYSMSALILVETKSVLILNKPRGVDTHGPQSLERAVSAYLSGSLPASLSFRPAPLHRLDRNTSGVVLFSRTIEGARRFTQLLRENRIEKWYLAVLRGFLVEQTQWRHVMSRDTASRKSHATPVTSQEGRDPAGRTPAATVHPLAWGTEGAGAGRGLPVTLARIQLHTGKTHQIRAQAAASGYPLAGDRKYGDSAAAPYLLHAGYVRLPAHDAVLGFRQVYAPLPAGFQTAASRFFGPDADALFSTGWLPGSAGDE